MTLRSLLKDIASINDEINCTISNITLDSRAIKPGDVFVAYAGQQYDGRKYITEAIQKGAAAILCERDDHQYTDITLKNHANQLIPIIPLFELQKKVGKIAANFYDDPSSQLTVLGFTGTNGKTSCSQFTAKCLEMDQQKCGIIGTLGIGFPDHLKAMPLTTPDAITLQSELAFLKAQGAKTIAIEVSSHSLAQHRVDGIHFNTAVFTNLTRDHLDYHGNMLNYANAKWRLFEQPGLRYAVINLDDPYGQQFLTKMPTSVQAFGYTIKQQTASVPIIAADNIQLSDAGFTATVHTPWGEGNLKSGLLGRFNVSNLLAVLTTLNLLQIPLDKALHYLSQLTTVSGRLQMFGGGEYPTIVVDYAHTPDALEKVLHALREHCKGKLCCVFGCGGERDRGKRPIMAEVAERCSDAVIVTDDNPRREYSQKIIEDIMAGFLYPQRVTVIADRHQAIAHAVKSAKAGDVVLIAGKGHEPYQIIGTEKLPFSDAAEVQKYLKS